MSNSSDTLRTWRAAAKSSVNSSSDPKVNFLLEAKRNGELIEVRYLGGSNPGKTRKIMPKGVFHVDGFGETTYLKAFCAIRGEDRTFRLDRLELLNEAARPPIRGRSGRNSFAKGGVASQSAAQLSSQGVVSRHPQEPKRTVPYSALSLLSESERVEFRAGSTSSNAGPGRFEPVIEPVIWAILIALMVIAALVLN